MSNLKNVHLATAVNVTTSYAGEFAGQYIAAALLSASTINDGGLTVKSNIYRFYVIFYITCIKCIFCTV